MQRLRRCKSSKTFQSIPGTLRVTQRDPESIRTARYLEMRCTTFDDSSQKRMFQVASKTSESSDTQLFCCNNQLMRTREHLRRAKRAPLLPAADLHQNRTILNVWHISNLLSLTESATVNLWRCNRRCYNRSTELFLAASSTTSIGWTMTGSETYDVQMDANRWRPEWPDQSSSESQWTGVKCLAANW